MAVPSSSPAPVKKPGRKAPAPVLLLHAILAIALIDGQFGPDEVGMIEGLFNTVPELLGVDFRDTYDQWEKLVAAYPDPGDALLALDDLESEALRRKAFVLACEVALASGDIGEDEVRVLERMQAILRIPQDLAERVVDVLEMKYGGAVA